MNVDTVENVISVLGELPAKQSKLVGKESLYKTLCYLQNVKHCNSNVGGI